MVVVGLVQHYSMYMNNSHRGLVQQLHFENSTRSKHISNRPLLQWNTMLQYLQKIIMEALLRCDQFRFLMHKCYIDTIAVSPQLICRQQRCTWFLRVDYLSRELNDVDNQVSWLLCIIWSIQCWGGLFGLCKLLSRASEAKNMRRGR